MSYRFESFGAKVPVLVRISDKGYRIYGGVKSRERIEVDDSV